MLNLNYLRLELRTQYPHYGTISTTSITSNRVNKKISELSPITVTYSISSLWYHIYYSYPLRQIESTRKFQIVLLFRSHIFLLRKILYLFTFVSVLRSKRVACTAHVSLKSYVQKIGK